MSDLPAGSAAFVEAVARVARDWRDPEHAPRAAAATRTLRAPNRFTEESIAFALNAASHRLTREALIEWAEPFARPASPCTVAVLPEGSTPLAALPAVLAVLLAGHRCLFVAPEASPVLVPEFVQAASKASREDVAFQSASGPSEALRLADGAIGGGEEADREAFESRCAEMNIPLERQCWRGGAVIAVIGEREDDDALEALAEDVLLYDGAGVRLIWAPTDTSPDAFLQALARFRAVFPAHSEAAGALQMQKAFLEATDQPHAYGEDLEFLLSRGTPDVQPPGHLRWIEYETAGTVRDWIRARGASLRAVVARKDLADSHALPESVLVLPPGTIHRRLLDAPGTDVLLQFVAGL